MYKNNFLKQMEFKKRKREIFYTLAIAFFLILFTLVQFRLYDISHKLPFLHSIFFFGLVNLNIVLLMFLCFLIFRNITKVFVERKGKFIGSSLQSKLIAAFLAFSFIPTFLIFLVSVFYINSSFDKWFSVKTLSVLKDSLEIPNYFYVYAKKKNYHFAEQILKEVNRGRPLEQELSRLKEKYSLDAVEYYPDFFSERIYSIADNISLSSDALPRLSLELLEKAIRDKADASTIHSSGYGNLVRVITPVREDSSLQQGGALVVSTFFPISIVSKITDVTSAYENFRDIDPLEYPIKSIYLVLLVMITLVILAVASWFGFHLAKELSIPLIKLGSAFKRITRGDYTPVEIQTGSSEVEYLTENFNYMTKELDRSEKIVKKANTNLQRALDVLDEHSKYIEVVISNISTGVISIDLENKIKTMNYKAKTLLGLEVNQVLDRSIYDVSPPEFNKTVQELIEAYHRGVSGRNTKKELVFKDGDRSLLLQVSLSPLEDDKNKLLGMVLVFDDLSVLVDAQRAAAWREVARRIAHEIKNPLTPIQLSAQRLNKKFAKQINDPAFQECTNTIISQVDALKSMVNEFSQFARLPEAKPVKAKLHDVISEAISLYDNAHKDLVIEKSFDVKVPEFYFDPEQIRRVIVNLIENSVSAMKDKTNKIVKISTTYDKSLKSVRIEIEDNGSGVSQELLNRLFDPYFTTKKEGSGLGLAIVKRIIQDHNGFIRAFNTRSGLKMIMELPIESKWTLSLDG